VISEYVAYRIGKSAGKRRAFDDVRYTTDYQIFEFLVIVRWFAMVVIWPIHLGKWIFRACGKPWIVIAVSTVIVVTGLILPVGYLLVGLLYASIWLALFIEEGKRQEEYAEQEIVVRFTMEERGRSDS
jgi:hypothetical protein